MAIINTFKFLIGVEELMTGLLFTGCSIHRFTTGLQGRHFPGADVAVIQGGAGAITRVTQN